MLIMENVGNIEEVNFLSLEVRFILFIAKICNNYEGKIQK